MGRAVNRALATALAVLYIASATSAFAGSSAPAQDTGGPWETGRVVAGVRPGTTSKELDKSARRSHARLVRTLAGGSVAVIDPRAGFSAAGVARELERESIVRHARPELRVRALLAPNDPAYPLQWGMARVGAPLAWDVQRGSGSVSVAVIDSGVEYGHPDLAGRVDTVNGWDFVDGDAQAQDDFGHGTHIAGIIAANTDNGLAVAGMAPGCTLMPLRALDAAGNGTDTSVAMAIRWAADRGAKVINLSLGSAERSLVMEEACDYAIARGCVVVAASGNSAAQVGWEPGQIQHPAAYAPVVAVGAVDQSGLRASFSEWGSALDLTAPGVGIVSLYPAGGQATLSGTSMAAAHVSGVAALIRSQHPGLSGPDTVALLESTAEDLGAAGKDYRFGSGLVRADRAFGAGTLPTPPPADDEIPGVPAPRTPILESLDAPGDANDVYSIALGVGDTLHARLSGPAAGGFVMNLYSPRAISVSQTSEVLASSHDALAYVVGDSEAGTYYLNIAALSGSGEYRVDWRVVAAQGANGDDGGGGKGDGEVSGVSEGTGDKSGDGVVRASGIARRWWSQHVDGSLAATRGGRSGGGAPRAQSNARPQSPAGSGQPGERTRGGGLRVGIFGLAVLGVLGFAAVGIWRVRARSSSVNGDRLR